MVLAARSPSGPDDGAAAVISSRTNSFRSSQEKPRANAGTGPYFLEKARRTPAGTGPLTILAIPSSALPEGRPQDARFPSENDRKNDPVKQANCRHVKGPPFQDAKV